MEIIIRSAKPTAASQAANTSRISGTVVDNVKFILRDNSAFKVNSDSIIPSRHSNEDIK